MDSRLVGYALKLRFVGEEPRGRDLQTKEGSRNANWLLAPHFDVELNPHRTNYRGATVVLDSRR